MTEKERYFSRLEDKIKRGIVDIQFAGTIEGPWDSILEEKVYTEFNRIEESAEMSYSNYL